MTAMRRYLRRKGRDFRPAIGWRPKQALDGLSYLNTASENSLKYLARKYMRLAHKIRWFNTKISLGRNIWCRNLWNSSKHSFQHYGGFKVRKSSLVASSSILKRLLPSLCMIMLQYMSFSSMLGPLLLSNIYTSNLGSIIFSCIWRIVPRNESTW